MTGLVVVPVYNEVGNLERVIAGLRERFPLSNLLFVDDGSRDGSHRLLEAAQVRYLRHPINLGYHEALRTGMCEMLDGDFDYVVFFDSDGQHRHEDLAKIIASFESDPADLIVGSRYQGEPRAGLTLRSFGTRFFSRLTTLLAGVRLTDVTNGLKLISRRSVPVALKLPTQDMHADLIVGLAQCGARIREVKITVLKREVGQSMYSVYSALVYPAKTFVCLLGQLVFYRRLRAQHALTRGACDADAGRTLSTLGEKR